MIHLDTGYLIRSLIPGTPQDRQFRQWIESGEAPGVSAVAWTEFLCGPVSAGEIDIAGRLLAERTPFTEEDAEIAARLFNDSGRRRGTLADCMMAAVSIRIGARLATTNRSDFERLEGSGLRLFA